MAPSSGALRGPVLVEAPALLERAVSYTRSCLPLVTRAAPDAVTPCAEWDLTRLLRHLDDALAAFTEAAETGYVAATAQARPDPDATAASLRDRTGRLLGAWAHEPGRPTVSVAGHEVATLLLAATGALEITVHGWDVARACGEDRPIPEELAASLLEVAPLVVRADDRPGRFAPAYDVAPTATTAERLLAFVGRR